VLVVSWVMTIPLVRRKVGGNVNKLVGIFGMSLDGDFSVMDLAFLLRNTSGGPDILLAVTVAMLVVVIPLLRPLTQLVVLLTVSLHHQRTSAVAPWTAADARAMPLGERLHGHVAVDTGRALGGAGRWLLALHRWSRYLSYFWALEVATATIPMLQIGCGLIPHEVFNPITFPFCNLLNEALGEGLCFQIELERLQVSSSQVKSSALLLLATLTCLDLTCLDLP